VQIFNQLQYVKKHIARSLIAGRTLKNGVPISCGVFVYDRKTGTLLSRAKSNSAGEYIVFGLNRRKTHVIAVDPVQEYNLATQDNI